MKILLDTSPLQSGHAIRGVGAYTRFLQAELLKISKKDSSLSLVSEHSQQPDIVHYPFFDLFFHTLKVPSTRHHKVVVTVHDVIPLLFPKQYLTGIKGKLRLWKQKRALRQVDAVLTDSFASKKDIHSYLSVPLEKIHVTYLAGNPEISPPSAQSLKKVEESYQLPEKFVLYVGDINYNKNVVSLIHALKEIPDFHLVCVGSQFYSHDIPEWNQIAEAMQEIEDRVHLITDLKSNASEDLAAMYSLATVYVQPSLYEGFGLPVLEAMQAGTVVVCANNSSLVEVAGNAAIMVETDPESIKSGILKAIELSRREREKIIQQGQTWAHEFSWEKTAKETIQVYRSLH